MYRIAVLACWGLLVAGVAGAQSAADADRSQTPGGDARASASRGAPALSAPCRADDAIEEPGDPKWQWRLRAYRHLDCVMSLADRALSAPSGRTGGARGGQEQVSMSREDLERIRTFAWWARDAVARVGQ
jgi:hypothetical protein